MVYQNVTKSLQTFVDLQIISIASQYSGGNHDDT